MATALYKAD